MRITKEDIFMAADLLAEQGIMPSILSVRSALGDTGSESTILKYLKEWKHKLLTKANVGCVFCSGLEEENKILQMRLESYIELCETLQAQCLEMLRSGNVHPITLHLKRTANAS